jgi:hypothetical protein
MRTLKKYYVTQCELVLHKGKGDVAVHVAWIPSDKAIIGKVLRIRDMPGEWMVRETYSQQRAEDRIEGETDYKRHRKATDV